MMLGRIGPHGERATAGALALGLGVAVLAGPANAGDASCLWRSLPPPTQTAILTGYAQHGSEGLADAPITNGLMRGLVRACTRRTPSEDQTRAAGGALAGKALATAAAAKLQTAFGLDARRLDAAWSGMSTEDKETLLRQFSRTEPTADEDARLYAVIRAVALGLGWRGPADKTSLGDPEFKAIADYVTGRAQASAFEARF